MLDTVASARKLNDALPLAIETPETCGSQRDCPLHSIPLPEQSTRFIRKSKASAHKSMVYHEYVGACRAVSVVERAAKELQNVGMT